MRKEITIGAAQLGPIARSDSRKVVVERLIELMRKGKKSGCDVVVYPELALTSFFPRWYMEHQEDVDSFFEHEMPGTTTKPLFQFAVENEIGFYLGYAELSQESGRYTDITRLFWSINLEKLSGNFAKCTSQAILIMNLVGNFNILRSVILRVETWVFLFGKTKV